MFEKVISLILVVVASLSSIKAQNGLPCHSSVLPFTPRHSLSISKYMGDWYMHEIASSDIGNFPTPDFKCAKRSLTLLNENDPLHIEAIDYYVNITNGAQVVQNKDVQVNASRSPLSSLWDMKHENVNGDEIKTDVIILFADLELAEWTVQYSCSIRGPDKYRYEVGMIMTRTREITPELRSYLKALTVGQGFRIGDHFPIDQTNCE